MFFEAKHLLPTFKHDSVNSLGTVDTFGRCLTVVLLARYVIQKATTREQCCTHRDLAGKREASAGTLLFVVVVVVCSSSSADGAAA